MNLEKVLKKEIRKEKEKTVMYLGDKIIAWVDVWEEFNEKKQRFETKKQIYCHLYRTGCKYQPLNLGECNDGSKFTAVNQAINQAKGFIDCCNENWY